MMVGEHRGIGISSAVSSASPALENWWGHGLLFCPEVKWAQSHSSLWNRQPALGRESASDSPQKLFLDSFCLSLSTLLLLALTKDGCPCPQGTAVLHCILSCAPGQWFSYALPCQFLITESKHSSGQGLLSPFSPAPLQQRHPEQGVQHHIQAAFGYLQAGKPHSLRAACALSPTLHRSAQRCSEGTSCVPVCSQCLLS